MNDNETTNDMSKEKTAVEWFIEKILTEQGKEEFEYLIKQAKQMEKEQIMSANSCGFSDGINHEKGLHVNFISCEQYYEFKYCKNGRK